VVNENKIPKRVGRYELDELLEEGIAGSLYRARDAETGAAVLVKVVSPLVSRNPAFGRYFYDKWAERKALVEHPNVLEPLEVARDGDLCYVAVQDVGGTRLSERLKGAPLPSDEALEILRQAAEGLRAIHRREAVHAHLKPTDVILTTDQMGRTLVKVVFVDLSVAAAESMVSIFGEMHGTPKYMAPEVIQGRSVGPEADAFALGVIAYEMVTGREPFPSDHALGYLFANCQTEAAPADRVNKDVPHEIALVVSRLLAKDPAQRYRSMQRVIDDLDRCVQRIKTGHAESVPYGTDSAFARHYEVPQPAQAGAAGKGVGGQKIVAVVVLVLVVGVLGFLAGGGGSGGPAPAAGPSGPSVNTVSPPSPSGRQAVATPAGIEREQTAKSEFNDAVKRDRENYSARGQFELGVAAFSAVARRYSDTAIAAECREQMARIHTEWAAALAADGNYSDAVEKYTLATEEAPQGSEFAVVAHAKLPGALASLAARLSTQGRYDEALAIEDRIAREHPGTKEAAAVQGDKARILFNKGFALWKESGDFDRALGTLAMLIKDYQGTESAEQAKQALPGLYLDGARQKLKEGQLAEARKQLLDLTKAYPEDPVATEAADLDAQLLYGLMKKADAAKDGTQSNLNWAELLRQHPTSKWTVAAAKIRLAVPPNEGSLYPTNVARQRLADARQRHEQFDFRGALGSLLSILQYGQPDSPEVADALRLYPQWRYESGLYDYGSGSPQEARATLEEVAAAFPGTEWAEQAQTVLGQMKESSETGMVYVPEGPFHMGTSKRDVEGILRQYCSDKLGNDPDQLSAFADMFGLLAETPEHIGTTGAFFIDRTEVTNAQYGKYVAAAHVAAPSTWHGSTCPAGEEDLPVVEVTLAQAQDYARWRGCRLPTEVEWEKAARGVDGRRFPWGAVFSDTACNHMRPEDAGLMAAESFTNYASPYGCLGMIGNAREWTSSPATAYEGSEWKAGEDIKRMVVARGGAWFQDYLAPIPARCASRYPKDPRNPDGATGFRCVRDAASPAGAAAAAATP
jgi:formylglycine-generating enzyme required for sulfatase activity/tetratricopeptide (TPR) repeat protein